jgi:hypothetical protein
MVNSTLTIERTHDTQSIIPKVTFSSIGKDEDTDWKNAELPPWLYELILSHTMSNDDSSVGDSHHRRSSYTSIWPSLMQFDCAHEIPLSILQITILPIVNHLREVCLYVCNNSCHLHT